MEVSIRYNDSLWYYSQLFDIPLALIESSNPSLVATQLAIGHKINIPGYYLEKYHINKNDSLWKIASTKNIPLDLLFLVNKQLNLNNLQIGEIILIPKRINSLIVTDVTNYTYEKMMNDLGRLISLYPFILTETVGQSVMGKELVEVQIGSGSNPVHLNGSFHANEWITTPIIIKFINEYALSLTNNKPINGIYPLPLYQSTFLSIVPMVNPDGVNLVINGAPKDNFYRSQVLSINKGSIDFSNWKANINGVDLNKQYPALWEEEAERKPKSPAPRDYPGPKPLSEPESIALAELVRKRNFSRVNAFHTQGKEIYWGFEGLEPPASVVIVNEYARVSGYEAVRFIDSFAGFKDWFIQDFRKPGFTIELGSGVNPLSIAQFPEIYQESMGIMLANLYL